jgi:outer membrane protein
MSVKHSAFIFAAAALLSAGFAASAAAADIKVGFVNTERVLRDSGPAKRAQAKLEKEFAPRKSELDKLEKQARDLQTQIQKDGVTMSDSDKREKDRQLQQIDRDFQRLSREFREDLNLRRNEELASIQEKATKVVNEIAEKERFDLILQEAVFASAKIDITDKVIKALADK